MSYIRPPTAAELAKLDSPNQFSRVYLAIQPASPVYTALVASTPASTDKLAQLAYNSGSGTLADVEIGMTLWVGSTAGGFDKGMARIRQLPDGSNFYIGETSELAAVAGNFITVLDEFSIWSRYPRPTDVLNSDQYMDYDIVYTDQHEVRAPIPVMGPHAVIFLRVQSKSVTFDASESWEPGGSAVTFAWTAPGASATAGMATATPTITYDEEGVYRVKLVATANGRSTTAYRYVFVYSNEQLPDAVFTPGPVSGDYGGGGWKFTITGYAGVDIQSVRDRALVVMFTRDYYADDEGSLGYLSGRENVKAWGWIYGDTISWDPEQSSVSFEVQGPKDWIARTQAFITGLEDQTSPPTRWDHYQSLNFKAAIWHNLLWRSTIPIVMDVVAEDNTWRAREISAPATSIWEQLNSISKLTILAQPTVDRYGRLWILKDSQLQADRSSYPEMFTINKNDWVRPASIGRDPVDKVAMVILNGVSFDGTNPTSYFALSPGHTYFRQGSVQNIEGLVLPDQATAQQLAGLLAGQLNNDYPRLTFNMGANNNFLDVAPPMYCLLSLAAADTPRNIELSLRMIPRKVSHAWDAVSGSFLTSVEFEGETFEQNSSEGDPPQVQPPIVPPPDPTCQDGYHWDSELLTCVQDSPPPAQDGELTYVFISNKCIRSRNFITGPVTYEDCTNGVTGTAVDARLFPSGPAHGAFWAFTNAVYRSDNLDDSPPTWASILTAAQIQTAMTLTGVRIDRLHIPITEPSGLYIGWKGTSSVSGEVLGISWAAEGSSGWAHSFIVTSAISGGVPGAPMVKRIIADPSIIGKVWAAAELQNFANNARISVSTDHGAHWSIYANVGFLNRLIDFDVSYPDSAATFVMLRNAHDAMYDYTGDAFGFQLAQTLAGSGTLNGYRYNCLINIATLDRDNVLLCTPAEDLTRFWLSVDRGLHYSLVYSADYGSGGADPVAFVQAVGRWPTDSQRVWWLAKDAGADGSGGGIWYTGDMFATVENKIGDAIGIIGTVHDLVQIIPVWI